MHEDKQRPKVYRVRHVKVWIEEWTALSRDEATEKSAAYHADEGYMAEDYNQTYTRPLRPATDEEMSDYYGDTDQEEEE